MKTYLKIFLFLVLGISTIAGETYPEEPDFVLLSKLSDPNLKVSRTKVIFQLNGIEPNKGTIQVVWSANKMIDTVTLTSKREISEILISGKYNFKFYYNSFYREIEIPRIVLESGYSYTIALNFKPERRENITVKKPVIYLYPEQETEVNIRVNPSGELSFTYPKYESNGWTVTAKPNGELNTQNQTYNYLFWESEQTQPTIQTNSGFIIPKEETITFLEKTLSQFGLNSKEKADFITFWGPQLMQNKRNFIQFKINEQCLEYAELMISPQPDNVYRIYLLFTDASEWQIEHDQIQEQLIPRMLRSGFTVIEWGGAEIKAIQL